MHSRTVMPLALNQIVLQYQLKISSDSYSTLCFPDSTDRAIEPD